MSSLEKAPAKGEGEKGISSDYDATEHLMAVDEVSAKYGVQVNKEKPGSSGGLTGTEAASRLAENGPNKLSPPKDKPEWLKYLLQYTNPLLGLLIVAAALTFVAYAIEDPKDDTNIILGVVLLLVIFMLGTSQYFDERAAGNVAAQLRSLLPSNALVLRDGKELSLPAPDLVAGDVVHLTLGSRVPADIKVIQTKDLKLDFSSLTGESDPIPMSITAQDEKAHESRNIAFMSSQVVNGEGYGIVIRCGDNTFIGKINALATQTKGTMTTLERDITLFIKVVACIAVTMAVVLFASGMGRKMDFEDAFVNGVVIVLVANIPQGLPATVTSALMVTATNMKNVSVLVKKTDIIESLGSATRIASDKTGTLTQNKMTVMHCWVNRHSKAAAEIVSSVVKPVDTNTPSHLKRASITRRSVKRVSATPVDVKDVNSGELVPGAKKDTALARVSARAGTDMVSRMSVGRTSVSGANIGQHLTRSSVMTFAVNVTKAGEVPGSVWDQLSPLTKLCIIACVSNRAQFEKDAVNTAGERKVLGDATDSGLLRFCDKIMDVDDVRANFESVFSIPFNSRNKWALNMVRIPGDADNYLVLIKGAPDYVIKKCGRYSYRDGEHVMDDQFLADVMDSNEGYASMAERVIGHAYKIVPAAQVPSTEEEADAMGLLDNFAFMGLLSLIDPPRDAVPAAVSSCRSAGVAVTMVTGDQPTTAEAVARKCGIITKATRREVAGLRQVPESSIALDDPNVEALVIPGTMIESDLKTDEDWDKVLCKDELVFARTTPQQKLKIVENFQRRGEIVAVTGDGVNDAPALRKANIGVAMGSPESSEVAREAASVVLIDDNFASLVAAIREGRVLYDNLKKTIVYSLAHIPPEFVPVILVLAFGMPLGLGSLLVLSIDLITSQLPAQSLAWEPAEANVMARPPRDIATERLVSFPLLCHAYLIVGGMQSLFSFLAWIWVYHHNGVATKDIFLLDPKDGIWLSRAENGDGNIAFSRGRPFSPEEQEDIVRQATSAWYITLIMCQAWHIWVCKTRRVSMFKHAGCIENRVTYYGVFVSLIIMVVCVYVPWLQDNVFFTANPPHVQAWVPHFAFLVVIVAYTEWEKWLARNNPQHWFVRWFVW